MCSASRYLVIAGLSAIAVASLTGSDLYGWLAAGVAALVWSRVERRLPSSLGACAAPTVRSRPAAGADPIPVRAEDEAGIHLR